MPQANKPAMTSGPGAQSRRTDGGPASKQAQRYIAGMPNYGDGQELMDLQASAPMASAPQTPAPSKTAITQAAMQGGQANPAMQQQQQVTPLLAPTERPNEPVTAGSPLGAGPGPEALGIMPGQQMGGTSAKQVVQSLAAHPDASPELRSLASVLGQ